MLRLGKVPSRIRCSASWRAVVVPKRKERPDAEEGASGVLRKEKGTLVGNQFRPSK